MTLPSSSSLTIRISTGELRNYESQMLGDDQVSIIVSMCSSPGLHKMVYYLNPKGVFGYRNHLIASPLRINTLKISETAPVPARQGLPFSCLLCLLVAIYILSAISALSAISLVNSNASCLMPFPSPLSNSPILTLPDLLNEVKSRRAGAHLLTFSPDPLPPRAQKPNT